MKNSVKLVSIGKQAFVVIVNGKETGVIQKIGKNSAWSAQCGIGMDGHHVGNSYKKDNAVEMAIDGLVRDVCEPC